MPGAPILHGFAPTSDTAAGTGGAARAAASAPLTNVGLGGDIGFFVWLVVIGVVLPLLIIGGLRVGGFQFVFRGR